MSDWGPESAYEEVIISCPCHDVCVESAGAVANKRRGMGPLGSAQGSESFGLEVGAGISELSVVGPADLQ